MASSGPREGEGQGEGRARDDAGDTLGRYRLLRKIARGGMAEVFAARSFGAHGFEKTVAIKRILSKFGNDPQFVRMMVDEAKITVLLNHPNVAQILELCEQEGDYFIVMEFVPGTSLSALRKQLADRGDRVPDLEACFITTEILQGLHAAHVQRDMAGNLANIIHRDVSPQNVLVSFDGHVKVIDFGIARARTRLELTEVGTIKGKLRYLAPEMIDPARFMKSGDFDHRVDVFAAGIVLWELIASRTLYQGDDEMAVYDSITDTDAPDLHAMKLCDKDLARIVKKALARNPEERFATAEDFADQLRAYVYRRDPTFTHKRVAALLDSCFATEKAEMLALERGIVLDRDGASGATRAEPRRPEERKPEPRKEPEERKPEPRKEPVSREPRPVATDAATSTHLHGSGSGGGPRAPGPKPEAREGEVLTVMTLVSRKSQPGGRRVEAEAPGAGASDRAARPFREQQTRTVQPHIADVSGAGGETVGVDETPHTSDSLRPSARGGLHRPARGRLILLSAAFGVIAALILVVVLELNGRDGPEPTAPPRAITPVKLVVSSTTPGARVSVAGTTLAPPAVFSALPGDVLDVVVSAPGFVERIERVRVARTQTEDLRLDLALVAALVEPDAGPAPVGADAGAVADVTPPQRPDRNPDRRGVVDKRPGKLKVTSKPSWALVSIDGKAYGETPVVQSLPPGKHKLVVTQPEKKKRYERTVMIRANEMTVESFEIE